MLLPWIARIATGLAAFWLGWLWGKQLVRKISGLLAIRPYRDDMLKGSIVDHIWKKTIIDIILLILAECGIVVGLWIVIFDFFK